LSSLVSFPNPISPSWLTVLVCACSPSPPCAASRLFSCGILNPVCTILSVVTVVCFRWTTRCAPYLLL
jgi:hypothetical protein